MNKILWVGNRLSDIDECKKIFCGSLNLYGTEEKEHKCFNKYRVNNNTVNIEAEKFISQNLDNLLKKDKDLKIMFYNPKKAYAFSETVQRNTLCLNDFFLLESLNDKISCHNILKNATNFAPYITLLGKNINLDFLKKIFGGKQKFVIQSARSSGGFGTFLLCEKNSDEIKKLISENQRYLVSVYIENSITFNIHLIIGKIDFIIFPASVQLIQKNSGRLSFRGSDFINTEQINKFASEKLAKDVIAKIKSLGYRGIVGLDMLQDLITGEQYLVELNCRFQGSSFLLNKALKDRNLISLQELNMKAFNGDKLIGLIPEDFKAYYSAVFYYNNEDNKIEIPNAMLTETVYDGLDFSTDIKDYAYLYKQIYRS